MTAKQITAVPDPFKALQNMTAKQITAVRDFYTK